MRSAPHRRDRSGHGQHRPLGTYCLLSGQAVRWAGRLSAWVEGGHRMFPRSFRTQNIKTDGAVFMLACNG
jgi:hypothetical protein